MHFAFSLSFSCGGIHRKFMAMAEPLLVQDPHNNNNEMFDNGGVAGLSMWNYTSLTKWLSFCGIVVLSNDDVGSFVKGANIFKKYIMPMIIPFIFVVSTIFQDLFCYGSIASCTKAELFGNPTYNSRTLYGWVGLIIAGSALHANMLNFARSGNLETLFNQVPTSMSAINSNDLSDSSNLRSSRFSIDSKKSNFEERVRKTIAAWVAGWVILVVLILVATTSFVIVKVTKSDCTPRSFICLIPQTVQIVSGLSVVFTGVGLSYLVSALVNYNIQFTKERCKNYIINDNLRSQLIEYVALKDRVKKLGKDTQIGNAIAFCGGCLCIFGSLWAFSEDYKDQNDTPVIYSLSLWMCLVSLFLTFLAIFSFSNVTQACDDLLENIRDEMGRYVLQKEQRTVSLSECFIMIATHQQRFGFEIMGVLVEPEIVRAGAYAGITAAAAILKLAI